LTIWASNGVAAMARPMPLFQAVQTETVYAWQMFGVGKYGTHRARHFFTEIMEQRFDIHVVFRDEQLKQGFRGTQLKTLKSCDFLYLALSGIVAVYYANVFPSSNQSWNVVLRAFVILSWILIPKNVTLTHCV